MKMRCVLFFVGLCFFASSAFCQTNDNRYVRLAHVGIEDKPFNIITISTHDVSLAEKGAKPGWEQMLITKATNYADLCKGIKQNAYLKMSAKHLKNDKPFYKVTVNGASFLLDEGNAYTFFRKLTVFMRKKPADADIAAKLDYINTRIGR